MDPINRLNSLAELIRKRSASEASARRAERSSLQPRDAGPTGRAGRADVAALRNRISDAVGAIDPDDPARNQKTMRLFVENVLTWQFGDDLLNDPGFANLVTEVQAVLETDPTAAGVLGGMLPGRTKSPP